MPTKKSAPKVPEALARELSFDQIGQLLYEALKKVYPYLDENGNPYSWGCRYHIQQLWQEKALIAAGYQAQPEDAKYALVSFSISEDKKSAILGSVTPVQIVAVPLEDGEPVVLDESVLAAPADTYEAGKRNSKSDAKKVNAALRAMLDMVDDDDLEEETWTMMGKKKDKKKTDLPKPTKEAVDLTLPLTVEESGWEALEGETIKEHFLVDMREAELDEENLIIRGTTILGPVSLNNRRYPAAVQEAAIPLFEGAKAYADHDPPNSIEARKMRDFIGKHMNVRVVDGKMRSDLHLSENETVTNYILPNAKKFPDAIGNSIVARVILERAKDGVDVATKIVRVRSVDMVTEPGTTNGLFEAHTLESHTPAAMQEDTMDLKTLTVEQLRTERADLIEALLADRKQAEEVAGLKSTNETLAKENAEKDRKLAEYEVKETARARARTISDLVAEMKAPDAFKYDVVEGKSVIKPTLVRVLERCQTEADMQVAVSEWEVICQEAQKAPDAKTPVAFESAITTPEQKPQGHRIEKLYAGLTH